MFAKLCSWAAMGLMACALSACGGGDPEQGAPTASASPADVLAASSGAAGAAVPYGAAASPAEQAGAITPAGSSLHGADAALQGTQAGIAYQASLQVVTMHGSSAYTVSDGARARLQHGLRHESRVLATRETDPDLADEESRERMALEEAEFEKSFSIEKNRELAERRALEGTLEPVGYQAYVPHEDCTDPRVPECAGGQRLAGN